MRWESMKSNRRGGGWIWNEGVKGSKDKREKWMKGDWKIIQEDNWQTTLAWQVSSSWTGRLNYCPAACLQALAQLAGTVMWRGRISTSTWKEGAKRKVEAVGVGMGCSKRLGELKVSNRRESSRGREGDRDRREWEQEWQQRKYEHRDRNRKTEE